MGGSGNLPGHRRGNGGGLGGRRGRLDQGRGRGHRSLRGGCGGNRRLRGRGGRHGPRPRHGDRRRGCAPFDPEPDEEVAEAGQCDENRDGPEDEPDARSALFLTSTGAASSRNRQDGVLVVLERLRHGSGSTALGRRALFSVFPLEGERYGGGRGVLREDGVEVHRLGFPRQASEGLVPRTFCRVGLRGENRRRLRLRFRLRENRLFFRGKSERDRDLRFRRIRLGLEQERDRAGVLDRFDLCLGHAPGGSAGGGRLAEGLASVAVPAQVHRPRRLAEGVLRLGRPVRGRRVGSLRRLRHRRGRRDEGRRRRGRRLGKSGPRRQKERALDEVLQGNALSSGVADPLQLLGTDLPRRAKGDLGLDRRTGRQLLQDLGDRREHAPHARGGEVFSAHPARRSQSPSGASAAMAREPFAPA